ncbi:MAG: hypothetical protein ACYC5O_02355 [Anaerolineae bacterium]
MLERYLPAERGHCECYVCGPIPMIRIVEDSLRDLDVPAAHVHSERYVLA